MKKNVLFIPLLLIYGLTISGCEEHWGDELAGFVDQKAHTLSVEHATADLHDRWLSAHQAQSVGVLTKLQSINQRLKAVTFPETTEQSKRVDFAKALSVIQSGLAIVLSLQAELEHMETAQAQWQGVCDSRRVFEDIGMNQIALPTPQIGTLPVPNYSAEISLPFDFALFLKSIGQGIQNTFAHTADNQNQQARDALGRFGNVVIHGDELFNMSKVQCHKTEQVVKEVQAASALIQTRLDQVIPTMRQALQGTQRINETRLAPMALEDMMRADGTLAFLARLENEREHGRQEILLATMQFATSRAARAATAPVSCEKRLSLLEDLEDLLVTHIAEIDFTRKHADTSNEAWLAKLDEFKSTLIATLTSTRSQLQGFQYRESALGVCL